jgi:hypothetical protein
MQGKSGGRTPKSRSPHLRSRGSQSRNRRETGSSSSTSSTSIEASPNGIVRSSSRGRKVIKTQAIDGHNVEDDKCSFELADVVPSNTGIEESKAIRYRNCIENSHAIFLVGSSCFFLIPAYYAYTLNLFYYTLISALTTAVSINHWRKAELGLRRDIDMLVAHISFAIYFASGCYYIIPIGGKELWMLAMPGCLLTLLFIHLSNRLMEMQSNKWVICHLIFHVFVTIEQMLVLRNQSPLPR